MLDCNIKSCPRCKKQFDCKVQDIHNCQCNIQLSQETMNFLKKTNYDCLCANCLLHFEDLNNKAKDLPFPTKKDMFKEGLHYYMENQYWVFTELYHLLRGHCCKSGCRHCVYGYKK